VSGCLWQEEEEEGSRGAKESFSSLTTECNTRYFICVYPRNVESVPRARAHAH